ncbi:MAG: UDP-glucuronate 4-epimerase, partial [Acidobacteriota bacterium]|nr:UDP-glucuronate 4-epimerase [Acidobacteriota bacterium]
MTKKRNILVTGGAGFIGSHLVERLLAEDAWRVTVVDDFNDFYAP